MRTHNPTYFPPYLESIHRWSWLTIRKSAQSLDKEQEEQLPQISPDKGTSRKRMRGTAKSLKPPKALKKKVEEIYEEVAQVDADADANAEEVVVIDDQAATEDRGIGSEDRPRKGGRGREPHTTAEMSDTEPYRTSPHGEAHTEWNTRLQKIKRQWGQEMVQV